MRNVQQTIYYQDVDMEFGYPSFPAYELEDIEDQEFGYIPFPAYKLDDDQH